MAARYSKDEKWVKGKGKPFHPHPNVWRRKGLGVTKAVGPGAAGAPAAQAAQAQAAAASPAAIAFPAAAAFPALANPIVPVVFWFIAIIFLALNVPTGGFTLWLGLIVAVIGVYIGYQQRAADPKNTIILFGLLMNCAVIGAVILVIVTSGPGPSPGGDCSAFGQANSCTGICAQGACHCQYAEAPVATCQSNADCQNQDTFCSSSGVCVWNEGGPAC